MRRVIFALAIAAFPSAASANDIEAAMRRVGPTYLCGAPHEFRAALKSLSASLVAAEVPEVLARLAVDGLQKLVVKEYAKERNTITAEKCTERYGR